MTAIRLTVGQALVRFLAAQRSERDGTEHRLIAGCFGIFGHRNVAGIGQALLEAELSGHPALPTARPAMSINRLPVLLLPGDIFATRGRQPGAATA